MRLTLPATRKGRVAAGVSVAVAVCGLGGALLEANQTPEEKQYQVCMSSYHDAKHCYDDVYHGGHPAPDWPMPQDHTPGTPLPAPQGPSVPPSVPNNPMVVHKFTFCDVCPLDTSQVQDLR